MSKLVKRFARNLKNDSRGASAIEFALVAMLLVVLIMGIIEFGWILNGHITLTGAAREGVRAAVVGGNHVEAVEHHLASLPSLTITSLTLHPTEGTIGDKMTVKLSGNLPLLTRFFDWLGAGGIYGLNAEATMRYVGESASGLPPGSGTGMEPFLPSTPTGTVSSNGRHINVTNVMNNATVYLYESIGDDPIATQTTNQNQTSVVFNNYAANNAGKTLYFRQEIVIDGASVFSDYGSIDIPN